MTLTKGHVFEKCGAGGDAVGVCPHPIHTLSKILVTGSAPPERGDCCLLKKNLPCRNPPGGGRINHTYFIYFLSSIGPKPVVCFQPDRPRRARNANFLTHFVLNFFFPVIIFVNRKGGPSAILRRDFANYHSLTA